MVSPILCIIPLELVWTKELFSDGNSGNCVISYKPIWYLRGNPSFNFPCIRFPIFLKSILIIWDIFIIDLMKLVLPLEVSFNPFTPKISSVILLTVCHTILVMLVLRIWDWINLQSHNWYFSLFSTLVFLILYWYWKEKFFLGLTHGSWRVHGRPWLNNSIPVVTPEPGTDLDILSSYLIFLIQNPRLNMFSPRDLDIPTHVILHVVSTSFQLILIWLH